MSVYAEFQREKRAIDELLAVGFQIGGIKEDLDGMHIVFSRPPSPKIEPVQTTLQLLNADARKYVAYLLFRASQEA